MKIIKAIAIMLILAGFLIIIGVAGASDHGTITLGQIALWGAIGIVIILVGGLIISRIER